MLRSFRFRSYPTGSGVEPWWSNGATTRLVLSEYFKYLFAHLRMRFDTVAAENGGIRLSGLHPPYHIH